MKKNSSERSTSAETGIRPDMRYRGPLSYRHLRALGWLCLIVAQIGTVIKIAQILTQSQESMAPTIMGTIGDLAVLLFLLANFALILNAKENFKKMILRYVIFCAAIIVLYLIVFVHYFTGILHALLPSDAEMQETLNMILPLIAKKGYLAFNPFVDLLLCTLFMFFLNYTPKKRFQGKKILLFRSMMFLPLSYEVVCLVLKILAALGKVTISPYCYPLLTTKPPVTFLLFLVLALFFKSREKKFLRQGNTQEDFNSFLQTNRNSFHISVHLAIALAVAAIVDLLLLFVVAFSVAAAGVENDTQTAIAVVNACGLGQSAMMILISPVMLLFSYNKTYSKKTSMVDLILPVAGVAGIAIVYIEGIYRIICMLPAILSALGAS